MRLVGRGVRGIDLLHPPTVATPSVSLGPACRALHAAQAANRQDRPWAAPAPYLLPTLCPLRPRPPPFSIDLTGCRAEAEGPAITELCSQLGHNYTLRALAVELPSYGQAYIDRNKQAHVVSVET